MMKVVAQMNVYVARDDRHSKGVGRERKPDPSIMYRRGSLVGANLCVVDTLQL